MREKTSSSALGPLQPPPDRAKISRPIWTMALPRFSDRDRRYAIRLAVELGLGRRTLSVITDNVGPRGLFVRSDICGPLRQLVELRIDLAFSMGRLEAHGMIAHVVPPGTAGSVPGMGIALYGLDAARRERWSSFIDTVRRRVPRMRSRALIAYPTQDRPPEPIRRRFERFRLVLEVQVMLIDELVTMYARDISRGGMLLQTDCTLEVGDGIVLRIVHPRNRDTLSVPCEVRRVVSEPDFHGVGVEFLDLDDEARSIFWAFIGAEVEALESEDVVLIDESELPA